MAGRVLCAGLNLPASPGGLAEMLRFAPSARSTITVRRAVSLYRSFYCMMLPDGETKPRDLLRGRARIKALCEIRAEEVPLLILDPHGRSKRTKVWRKVTSCTGNKATNTSLKRHHTSDEPGQGASYAQGQAHNNTRRLLGTRSRPSKCQENVSDAT